MEGGALQRNKEEILILGCEVAIGELNLRTRKWLTLTR